MGVLLSLGNLDVLVAKKFIFFFKCLDFYGLIDCFVMKSEFNGNP